MFSCTHAQMHETSLAQPQAVLYLAQHMFHGYSMDYILKTEFFFFNYNLLLDGSFTFC